MGFYYSDGKRTYFNSTSLLLFIKLIDFFIDLIFINWICPSLAALRKYQSWSEQQEILIDEKFETFNSTILALRVEVGLYSSWGCIVSKSVFDWDNISF